LGAIVCVCAFKVFKSNSINRELHNCWLSLGKDSEYFIKEIFPKTLAIAEKACPVGVRKKPKTHFLYNNKKL
jgi:hypothetical protein